MDALRHSPASHFGDAVAPPLTPEQREESELRRRWRALETEAAALQAWANGPLRTRIGLAAHILRRGHRFPSLPQEPRP